MHSQSASVLLTATMLLTSGPSSATTPEEIGACLARNAPKVSSELEVTLESLHKGDSKVTHRGGIHWRISEDGRSETLICMSHPPDLRGLAYLIVEDAENAEEVDLWGYVPEQKRVNQIHPRGAARRARIARTAIGFDDLRYLPMNTSGTASQPPRDEKLGSRDVTVVDLSLPPGEDSVYERIVSFVDKQTCVPLRTEFYETPDQLLKVMTADPSTIERIGDVHVARTTTVEDFKNEVRTELRIEKIELDAGLPSKMFNPNRLGRNVCNQ